jgi:hypothetical protein
MPEISKFNLPNLKGKAIPLQPWTGPEGSRRLRSPEFKTVSKRWCFIEGGKVVNPTHRLPLPPGNIPGGYVNKNYNHTI